MRTILRKQVIVLSAIGVLLSGGVALAHVYSDQTSLSLTANHTTIHLGQKVVLSGKLSALHGFCRQGSVIHLYANSTAVATTLTVNSLYSFVRYPPRGNTVYYTRFPGKVGGTHTHAHACLKSTSKNVTVHVI